MKIAIHGRDFKRESRSIIDLVLRELKVHNVEVWISAPFKKILRTSKVTDHIKNVYDPGERVDKYDLFLSIGGDGTLLETVTHVGASEIPILGINTGKLGFLATISKNDISKAIDAVVNGDYETDDRSLIRLESKDGLFGDVNFALNDFTVLKKDTSSMIVVHAYINGEFLNSYWADGLIVSTPTGSTGYSLSCGGPIMISQSNSFIITPVSPHNLAVRPLVVSDDSIISFKMESRKKKIMVSLDSRYLTIDSGIDLMVKKEKFNAKLVKLKEHSFFDTLRQKLTWGYDIRN